MRWVTVGEVGGDGRSEWSICKVFINMSNWEITIKIKNKKKVHSTQRMLSLSSGLLIHLNMHACIFVHTKWWALQSGDAYL